MENKLAIITGGSNGIGKSIANLLTGKRVTVVNADFSKPTDKHPHLHHFSCDIRSAGDIQRLYTEVIRSFKVPDIIVLNAGIGVHERLDEGDPEKWQQVFDTNVMGALRILRAFLPDMKSRKSGHVVFISSVSAGRAYPYGGIYSASKKALDVLAETLRLEVHPFIKVTVISPGITTSNFFDNELSGNRSLKEFGIQGLSPEDIAGQVLNVIMNTSRLVVNNIVLRPEAQDF